MTENTEVHQIIDKTLTAAGYEAQDAWYLRGNILRALRLAGYRIEKDK